MDARPGAESRGSSRVSYFGSALRLDEPEKRRSRALVLACSGWVPVTQPSVAPLRAVFQTLALGSLESGESEALHATRRRSARRDAHLLALET